MKRPIFKTLLLALVTLITFNCQAMACFFPQINVMIAEQDGKAKLAEAESSRRIAVLEAQAKLDAAKMLGDAEVARAEGVAKANKIIGDSLKNNESYLRYLWINEISNQPNVIYVPTEAGLPILEAGKRK